MANSTSKPGLLYLGYQPNTAREQWDPREKKTAGIPPEAGHREAISIAFQKS
ncbi:MAG: hypothetical protein CM1200mP29_06460 [Verrucomicrobiota bacterium]|nr:MAG: hypothetical protein CM1200mP29_06460 [Verrucomicrobiota bacterium]